jgi:peptidoglycan glycosyltransferase
VITLHGFERRLSAAGTASLAVLFAIFCALAYWQTFRTDLADDDRNPRVLSAFYDPGRGSILDRDGNTLAETARDGSRQYYDASTAHLVGYLDPRYGSQGIELAFNEVLSGTAPSGWEGAFRAEFDRSRPVGNDVVLTIDPAVQAAAVLKHGAARSWRSTLVPAKSWRWSVSRRMTRERWQPAERTSLATLSRHF